MVLGLGTEVSTSAMPFGISTTTTQVQNARKVMGMRQAKPPMMYILRARKAAFSHRKRMKAAGFHLKNSMISVRISLSRPPLYAVSWPRLERVGTWAKKAISNDIIGSSGCRCSFWPLQYTDWYMCLSVRMPLGCSWHWKGSRRKEKTMMNQILNAF